LSVRKPGAGVILIGGMVLFAAAAVSVIAWAFVGSGAGKERGLIFKNFSDTTLVLHINGNEVTVKPGSPQTVPVRASQFPQTLGVSDEAGSLRYAREFQFSEFQDYQFYIAMQDDGFATYTDPTLR
jgi:hypothetical protein